MIAIPKPGKDPSIPKSYRPLSLLCIPYKLYERLLLMRISLIVDEKLTKDQAGFIPGLTQHIEDGYERKMLTGTACVDLLAAYDTVQHRLMERRSSVVECRTRNQVSPDSNPSLLPFRILGIFVLSIDAPVHSAV